MDLLTLFRIRFMHHTCTPSTITLAGRAGGGRLPGASAGGGLVQAAIAHRQRCWRSGELVEGERTTDQSANPGLQPH